MQFKTLLQSKTFWINFISIVYVLVTGNVSALQPLHMNDHLTATIVGLINIINRYAFTNSAISGVLK